MEKAQFDEKEKRNDDKEQWQISYAHHKHQNHSRAKSTKTQNEKNNNIVRTHISLHFYTKTMKSSATNNQYTRTPTTSNTYESSSIHFNALYCFHRSELMTMTLRICAVFVLMGMLSGAQDNTRQHKAHIENVPGSQILKCIFKIGSKSWSFLNIRFPSD